MAPLFLSKVAVTRANLIQAATGAKETEEDKWQEITKDCISLL